MGVALREIKVCSAVGVLELTRSWAVNVNDGARDDRGDGEENEEHEGDEEDSDEEDEEEGSGEEDSDMDSDEFHSVDSGSSTPSSTSSFDRARHLSPLTLAIPPDELTDTFPTTALLHILSSARSSTHLHLAYTEPLLAHDPRIASALAALPSITHIVFSQVGPLGCELLQNLQARLEDVQVDFDDTWVASIITASFAKPSPDTIVPSLPNGESSGLPTPVPTPATTPAAPASGILPDPVPLLAHSMGTLKTLRASNAIIVTVADKLRYPFVRTLSLRLAGVPTVTPLVHAFPGVADMYVYTPFDGCGVRAPAPTPPSPESPTSPTTPTKPRKRRLRPPMPSLDATREANRTSQLYSSFPPLACVRGFAPGLYALGLTCAISRLEVGAVSVDGREAEAVRKLLVDTSPRSVSVGLSRGWWAPRTSTKGKEREALRTMFGGDGGGVEGADGSDGLGSGGEAWAGLSELVVRVEEPGRWADVTVSLVISARRSSIPLFMSHSVAYALAIVLTDIFPLRFHRQTSSPCCSHSRAHSRPSFCTGTGPPCPSIAYRPTTTRSMTSRTPTPHTCAARALRRSCVASRNKCPSYATCSSSSSTTRPLHIPPVLLTPPSPFGFLLVRGESSGGIGALTAQMGGCVLTRLGSLRRGRSWTLRGSVSKIGCGITPSACLRVTIYKTAEVRILWW